MSSRYARHRQFAFFVALFSSALLLGPALAHALELPHKIDLTRDEYFTVQQLYSGWSSLGVLLSVQMTGLLAVCIISRRDRRVFPFVLVATGLVVVGQVIFWTVTYPANAFTSNWTVIPDQWEVVRARWEYSHLANAICQVTALAALIWATLRRSAPTTPSRRGIPPAEARGRA